LEREEGEKGEEGVLDSAKSTPVRVGGIVVGKIWTEGSYIF
jgi:hypothetical protein